MIGKKRGFLLYFDTRGLIDLLPPEQRGWLLSAVMAFAARAAEEPDLDEGAVFAEFPALGEEGRALAKYLCGIIRRDTERWQSQAASRERRREAKAAANTVVDDIYKYI